MITILPVTAGLEIEVKTSIKYITFFLETS